MSTVHTKTTLSDIFKYGFEALQNRRKELFLISLYFLVLPNFVAAVAWGTAAAVTVPTLASLQALSPRLQFEGIFQIVSTRIFGVTFFATVMGMIGILALARSSVDYFESFPGTLRQVSMRSLRVLLTKGLGCFFLLVMVLPTLLLMPLLRAVAMSLLVMLPVTLVTGTHGGFRIGWDTLLLRYANKTKFGRWPVFINVLSVAGIFLTVFFGGSLLIEYLAVADTLLEIPAGFLGSTIHVGGLSINGGLALSSVLQVLWESFALATIVPFTAAIHHLSTVPAGHVAFETTV